MIEPRLVALHRRDDLAEARGAGKLTVQQRHELALRAERANAAVGLVLLHTPLERSPGNELQDVVKEAILVAHGANLLPCSMKPPSSRITEESAPCSLSIRTEPDSRERCFASTAARPVPTRSRAPRCSLPRLAGGERAKTVHVLRREAQRLPVEPAFEQQRASGVPRALEPRLQFGLEPRELLLRQVPVAVGVDQPTTAANSVQLHVLRA